MRRLSLCKSFLAISATASVASALWSCSKETHPGSKVASVQITEANNLEVIAFGDWGRGNSAQFNHAKGLQKHCKSEKCDFGLMLGDNFYPAGVKSVDDPKFKNLFEDQYGPLGILFYVVLGNHDYGEILQKGNPQAQIDYSKKSQYWRMPARYYSVVKGDTTIFGLDTEKFDDGQIQWLEKEIANSKTKWKIVTGHHPIHSYGEHGDTAELVSKLLPKLCNKVDLYLAGHDHDMQVLKADCGLPVVVSGAGASLRATNSGPRSKFAISAPGFAKLSITDESIKVRFIGTETQKSLYQFDIAKQ